jgi:hypothetical protein
MYIVTNENLGPKVWLAALDEIMRLLLEHGIIVGNSDELIIAKTLHICSINKIRITHFIGFSNNWRLVELYECQSNNPNRRWQNAHCSPCGIALG